MRVEHTLQPEYDKNSRILILGTMPSPKSRETGFYYGHPQNRFWRLLAFVLKEKIPSSIEDKRQLLNKYGVALWDVLESCEIKGASDSSIKKAKANDINIILNVADIKAIFVTGKKAESLYNKLCLPVTNFPCICLSSPSPANCTKSFDDLKKEYLIIRKYLQ